MRYVDGYILPIPKKNLTAYRKMAQKAGKLWRKHGALDYKECVGEDFKTEWGIPFSKAFKIKAGETVIFAYIVFKSRAHRDQVNAKVMNDPAMKEGMADMADKPMPFEMKRMIYSGFEVIVDA